MQLHLVRAGVVELPQDPEQQRVAQRMREYANPRSASLFRYQLAKFLEVGLSLPDAFGVIEVFS